MTILELWNLIKKHSKLVIALPVVFALAMAFYSVVFMPNQYTAETSVYVLTKAPADNGQAGFTSSDLTASQMLTNDIAGLFTSNRVEGETAKSLGLENLENSESYNVRDCSFAVPFFSLKDRKSTRLNSSH